jgi:hypothetical protein
MCSNDEFEKWSRGEVLYWGEEDRFATSDEIMNELKAKSWYKDVDWDDEDAVYDVFCDEGIKTYNDFFDDYDYNTYAHSYTTPGGEKVIAFGYYGYN